jgi:hypothetical protein
VPVTLFSEQEKTATRARTYGAPVISWRFTVVPMTRANCFSQVAFHTVMRLRVETSHHQQIVRATSNAKGRRAIYIRQAKRSDRH